MPLKAFQELQGDLFLSKGSKIYTEEEIHSLNFHYSGDDIRNNSRKTLTVVKVESKSSPVERGRR